MKNETMIRLILGASLLPIGAAASASGLHPRPLGLFSSRQVPLLTQPESVGSLIPPDAPLAGVAAPAEDEQVQALRESGLDAGQIRQVAQLSAPRRGEKDEVAAEGRPAKKRLPAPRHEAR